MDLKGELASLKQRRRSVRPEEMHALLTEAGFKRRYGKGDHWVYTHPRRRFPLTIDPRKPAVTRVRVESDSSDRGGPCR
jgi:predicted RNA binding protein YcfA (HicA-like mRNA interferase family)